MHHSRLVGGLAALAVLLILCGAPAAGAASLPLVWSGDLSTADSAGFTSVATGPDGAVYAAGYGERNDAGTTSSLLLVKYVDTGATMSQAWVVMPAGAYTAAAEVAVDASGNVIVAGTQGPMAFHGAGSDIVVLKFSPAGDLLWKATYDGAPHRSDYVKDLALDADGNAVVVGASAGGRTGRDYITVKFLADGSRAWARRYAGPSDFDEARSVAVDPKGNVYVTGQSRIPASKPGVSGPPRVVTISYSPTGVRRWIILDRRKSASSGSAIMYCGVEGAKGVVLAGWRYSGRPATGHTVFTKYTLGGRVIWSRTPNGGTRWDEWPEDAALDATGAPVAAGIRQQPGIAGVAHRRLGDRRRGLAQLVHQRVRQPRLGRVRIRRCRRGRSRARRRRHGVGRDGRDGRHADHVPGPLQPGLAGDGPARLRRRTAARPPRTPARRSPSAPTACTPSDGRAARPATRTPCCSSSRRSERPRPARRRAAGRADGAGGRQSLPPRRRLQRP